MKVYLAGPMRGLPDFNFPEFYRHAHALRKEGHEVFNPAEIGIHQDNIRQIFAVEMDWLCREAEAVALMPGWSESLGARAELALARALGLKVMGVPDFLPMRPLGKPFRLEQEFSTTSQTPLRKLPRYHSPDKSSMEPQGGTAVSQAMKAMRLFAISLLAAVLIMTGLDTALRWLGVL